MILIISLAIMGIAGAVCVARGRALTANCIWAITNPGLILYNVLIDEYVMAFMFVVYEAVALYGVLNLSRKTTTST